MQTIITRLAHLRFTRITVYGFIAILIASGILLGGYFLTIKPAERSITKFISEVYGNFGVELVSIAVTVGVIEELNRQASRRERLQELILQMGSPDNGFAVEAVRLLRHLGALNDGNLRDADLRDANLQGALLAAADLQEANLWRAVLKDARLWEANLHKAMLASANLQGTDLLGANLREADLREANLQGANLRTANLQESRLEEANLQEADLREANLQKATLTRGKLQGARLRQANLQGVHLWQANLQGTDLREANLQGAILSSARFDENTILPDETHWTSETDLSSFTDPNHAKFWRSNNRLSPAFRGDTP
jgi:uncharacterized protein YjbI with pentapeptide repeats